MSGEQGRKTVESARYRLRAKLIEVRRSAPADATTHQVIDRLVAKLEGIDAGSGGALAELAMIEQEIDALGVAVDAPFARAMGLPKWFRLAVIALPVIALGLLVWIVVERRRRKQQISKSAMQALDRGGG